MLSKHLPIIACVQAVHTLSAVLDVHSLAVGASLLTPGSATRAPRSLARGASGKVWADGAESVTPHRPRHDGYLPILVLHFPMNW